MYLHIFLSICLRNWAAIVAQLVKSLPAMPETCVRSLGWEDPLENGLATNSSILAWRIPMDRGAWQAIVHGVAKSQTQLSDLAQNNIYIIIHVYLYLFTEIDLFIFASLSLSTYFRICLPSICHLQCSLLLFRRDYFLPSQGLDDN